MTTTPEPDWENVCPHVKPGDEHYWECAARKEELEIIAEMREEPPFEEQLMERAQPIPEAPDVARARRKSEKKPSKQALSGPPAAPSSGLTALLEQLAVGNAGKIVMWAGPVVLLGLWWLYSRKTPAQVSDGTVEAWGVRWQSAGKTLERLFLKAEVAAQFASALKGAGAQGILVSGQPIRVKPDDARLSKNQPGQAQAA